MNRVVTVGQMRECETQAAKIGLNEDILIENAAASMLGAIEGELGRKNKIAVVIGCGNNGADGASLARLLMLKGYRTDAVKAGEKSNAAVKSRLAAFAALGGRIYTLREFEKRVDLYDVIIDAVFGVGLNRAADGEFKTAIELINGVGAKVIAADIPSGLCADSGKALGCAVKADITVTFSAYKYGHFLGDGADFCGRVKVVNIGIPVSVGAILCEDETPRLPSRKRVAHKGDYGRVCIIGGCPTMTGAPQLCALSALKNGAGLVTICVARSLKDAFYDKVKEATLAFLPDKDGYIAFDEIALRELTQNADVVALGMGMGANEDLPDILGYLCRNFEGTVILDADALNAVKGRDDIFEGHKCRLVLTPHRGEFRRLFGECDESKIIDRTREVAKKLNAVVVNKSNCTVISDGERVYINAAGSPAMAKGGSGDALAGAIAALSARLDIAEAAAKACYIMGKAGEKASQELGENSVLVSESIDLI